MTQSSRSLYAKRYLLETELGAGGMGVVYRAIDRLTGQTVALKQVIHRDDDHLDDDLNERNDRRVALAREFQTLASLHHPHIISVLDYGFDDFGQPFFTMPLLADAHDLLEAGKHQPVPDRITLIVQTLQALAYLHRRGILHRDLKPANVLVVEKNVNLLDFGLAQDRNAQSQPAGTLAYMAPELFGRGKPSEASDLYAVGIMTYELLVGRHPYDLSNPLFIFQQLEEGTVDFEPLRHLIPLKADPPTTRLPDTTQADKREVMELDLVPDTEPNGTDLPFPPVIETVQPNTADHPLTSIVQKMMSRNPVQRYQEAQTIIPALCDAAHVPLPQETIAIRESFLQAARLVGRDAELKTLLHGLERAIGWESSGSLIGGESGVGKSRLMEELRIRALVNGALVVVGQAIGAGSSPYQVWREPLRRLILGSRIDEIDAGVLKSVVSDIDLLLSKSITPTAALTGETAQARLTAIVGQMIRQQDQPVVILLEDLHWAGSESLALINSLLTIPDLPLLMVGTYRDDDMPDLPTQLPALQLMKLARLPENDIRQLSESMLGEAGRKPEIVGLLQRETEGNVYFLVEIVRALAEEAGELSKVGKMELPDTVVAGGIQRIVQRRLSRVPAEYHPLLKLAAIAGRELDLKLMNTVATPHVIGAIRHEILPTGVTLDQWLTTCAYATILEVNAGAWRFAHDKLREGVLAGLTDRELKSLHRHIATSLETVYADTPDYSARLTYHWGQVGDPKKEAFYAELAGDHALNTSAYRDALTYLERAMALTAEYTTDFAQQARLKYRLGRAHVHLNDYEQAETLYKEALALARRYSEPETAANALRGLGVVAWQHGAMDDAVGRFRESLSMCQQNHDQRGEGLALSNLANTYSFMGELPLALGYYERALTIQQAIGDRLNEGNTLGGLGAAYRNLGEIEKAIEMQQAALAILQETGDRRGKANTLTNLGVASFDLGEMTQAVDHFQQAVNIFREIGDRRGEESGLFNLGTAYQTLAQFNQAATVLEQALTLARASGDTPRLRDILSSLGEVCLMLARAADAVRFLDESIALMRKADEADTESYLMLLVNLGRAHHALGDLDMGGQVLSGAYWKAEKQSFTDLMPLIVPEYVKSYLYLGWWKEAAQLIETHLDTVGQNPLVLTLAGIAHARLNHRPEARNNFEAAIHAAEEALAESDTNYTAYYACALACTGLAFMMPDPGELLQMAGDMIMVGREVCNAMGLVAEVVRLAELLNPLDYSGVLPYLRQALLE